MPERRTIAFETSCQNVGLALTLVAFAFEGDKKDISLYTQFPLAFSLFMMVEALILCILIKIYQVIRDRRRKTMGNINKESSEIENDPNQESNGKLEIPESENGIIINKVCIDEITKTKDHEHLKSEHPTYKKIINN